MIDDAALAARQRLDRLLGVGVDDRLVASEPDAIARTVGAEWVAGFADSSGARISVLFIGDPDDRERVIQEFRGHLSGWEEQLVTNGGMVFFGRVPVESGERGADRLAELAARFSGAE